jgi:hypothetical protein
MNARTAEIAALQTAHCREEVRQASCDAIELALCLARGGHEPAELKRLIKLLQKEVDRMDSSADMLQEAKFDEEEANQVPSHREVGLRAAYSIDRERAQEINHG